MAGPFNTLVSPSQIAPMVALVETTYGTPPAGAGKGFLSVNAPVAVQPELNTFDLTPHQSSWSPSKSIPTFAALNLNFSVPVQAGLTATQPGPLSPIMQCAGLVEALPGTGVNWKTAVTAIGATQVTMSGGTGTILEGNLVTFGTLANDYYLVTGVAGTTLKFTPGLHSALANLTPVNLVQGVTYRPANYRNVKSAMIAQQWATAIPGAAATQTIEHEVRGAYGSLIFRGSAEQGLLAEFKGTGLFDKTLVTQGDPNGRFAAWSGGANNANKFILSGANKFSWKVGTATYVGIVRSVELDLGVEITPVRDVNSGESYGTYVLLITGRKPQLTVEVAVDTSSAAGSGKFSTFYDNWEAANLYDPMQFTYTDIAGRKVTFIMTGQLTRFAVQDRDKLRVAQCTFQLVPPAGDPDSEFVIVTW